MVSIFVLTFPKVGTIRDRFYVFYVYRAMKVSLGILGIEEASKRPASQTGVACEWQVCIQTERPVLPVASLGSKYLFKNQKNFILVFKN